MSEKLRSLYNTLCQISTKGDSTLIMSDCLKFLSHLIEENKKSEKATEELKMRIKELENESAK